MLKAIKYILVFFAFQILAGLFVMIPVSFWGMDYSRAMLVSLLLSDILFISYIFLIKEARPAKDSFKVQPWTLLLCCVLVWLAYFLPEIRIIETLDLPDTVFKSIDTTSFFSLLGVLAIGIAGPIAEELLFRGVVLNSLLKWDRIKGRPWLAIILSAALFCLCHLNPAQLPASLSMGLFFGWLCYRTGSLLPGIVLHVFNNSMLCFAGMFSTEESGLESLTESFRSQWIEDIAVALSLIVCIECLVLVVQIVNRHYPLKESARTMLADSEAMDDGGSEGVA